MAKTTNTIDIPTDTTGSPTPVTPPASPGPEQAAPSTVSTVKHAQPKTPPTADPEDAETKGEQAPPASPTLNANLAGGTFAPLDEQALILAPNARPLSIKEMEELKVYEDTIRAGLPTFLAVGRALHAIQRKKLFRIYATTMAEYCDKYLGISRVYAHMQASAAEVMDNLLTLTNGEQIVMPTSERQIRPLVVLKTAEEQVTAWKRAQVLAGGEKVSGADVDKAVKELRKVAPKETWVTKSARKLVTAGYETGFDQPVNVGDEWIDLFDPKTEGYIKLIDVPISLASLGICLALRDQGIKCQAIVNGDHVDKNRVKKNQAGVPTKLEDPVLSVLIKSLDALFLQGGAIYQGGKLDDDSLLELVKAETGEAKALGAALAMEGAVAA